MGKQSYRYFQDEKDDKLSQKIFIKFVVIFFCAYLVLMGLTFIFYQNYSYVTISGKSMMSTLNPNPVLMEMKDGSSEYVQDGVYIRRTQDVDRNDIVVIDTTKKGAKEKKTIIKRVIGIEGDFITIAKVKNEDQEDEYHVLRVKSGSEKVEVLQEDYIFSYADWTPPEASINDITINGVTYEGLFYNTFKLVYNYSSKAYEVAELDGKKAIFFEVPQDTVFCLGDNRAHSLDSRNSDHGCFDISKIDGKVVDIVRDGTAYKGNNFWWFNRVKGFFRVIFKEFLGIFGVKS